MSGNPVRIESPCDDLSFLVAGDRVLLSGRVVTGRDLAHRRMALHPDQIPDNLIEALKGAFIYHCGPVVVRDNGSYRLVSAGPTTSAREEPYQSAVVERFGIRGVIGKGGMGRRTADALSACGAVYLHATGGAGASLAAAVESVESVYFLDEFGVPEAMWVLVVRDFPAVVTMDSHGRSVHEEVLAASRQERDGLVGI